LSDWTALCGSVLWVLGLAIVLSTLSYAHWLAREHALRFRAVLASSPVQITCGLGLVLVSMGLFFSSRSIGERICWALFVLLCTVLSLKQGLLSRGKSSFSNRNTNSKTQG
jgi:hypothetical protein